MYSSLTALAVFIVALGGSTSSARPCSPGLEEGHTVGRSLQQAEDCKVEFGIDFPSNHPINNGNLPENIVNSPGECCEICRRTPDCKSWVMILTDTRWNKRGACWLKDEVPTRTNCLVCAGGVAPERPPVPVTPRIQDEECLFLPGLDFQGGDITVHEDVWSDDKCCDLCKFQGPSCKAWTRVNDGKCWLKHTVNLPSICPKCETSGIIESRQSSGDLLKLAEFLKIVRDNLDRGDGDMQPEESSILRDGIDGFLGRVKFVEG